MPLPIFRYIVYGIINTNEPNVPAIQPSIDFFGLISVNLCFPILEPTIYANVSVPQAAKNAYQTKNLPFLQTLLLA